jgi:hypothetical protein
MTNKKNIQQKTDNKQKSKIYEIQKWLLNFAIVCLAIIIFSFMLSSTKRFSSNSNKIDLSRKAVVNEIPRHADICLEVLNGSGITGIAGKYTDFLRKKGFDVIYTGNADKMDYPETFVFTNDTSDAKMSPLLGSLEFTKSRIEYNRSLDSHITFRIILGKDCERLAVFESIKKMENNF